MNPRCLIGSVLLAFGASAIAETPTQRQQSVTNCDGNQAEMNVCAGYRFEQADKALNQQYKKNMKLKDAAAQSRLREAQRAWITFRDKDCLAEVGPRADSGSIWPLMHFSCLEKHTERRTEDLRIQACGMEACAK